MLNFEDTKIMLKSQGFEAKQIKFSSNGDMLSYILKAQ